jgi:N-acetylmuramic acid 6-phosphate etherase
MKAGTAQRVALNLLSTLVMIRLGRVHEGLMVDVQAINAKLAGRSQNILRRLSGRNEQELSDALQQAGGNVKKAMLILQGCTPEKAAALLRQTGGRLRTALRLAGVSETASEIPTVDADVASAVPDRVEEK